MSGTPSRTQTVIAGSALLALLATSPVVARTRATLRDLSGLAPRHACAVALARGPFPLHARLALEHSPERGTGDALRAVALGLDREVLAALLQSNPPPVRAAMLALDAYGEAPGSQGGVHVIAFEGRFGTDPSKQLQRLPGARTITLPGLALQAITRTHSCGTYRWTEHLAMPRADLLVCAPSASALRAVLAQASSPRAGVELPATLQEPSAQLDTQADFWGVHVPSARDLLWSGVSAIERPDAITVAWRPGSRLRIACTGHTASLPASVRGAFAKRALRFEHDSFGAVEVVQGSGLSTPMLESTVLEALGLDPPAPHSLNKQ